MSFFVEMLSAKILMRRTKQSYKTQKCCAIRCSVRRKYGNRKRKENEEEIYKFYIDRVEKFNEKYEADVEQGDLGNLDEKTKGNKREWTII